MSTTTIIITDRMDLKMQYWFTTQWPSDRPHDKVNIRVQHAARFAGMRPGDMVFFYELKTGKKPVNFGRCASGRQGVVKMGRVTAGISPAIKTVAYTDGSICTWQYVDTEMICGKGFVSRGDANRCLGYAENWTLHGFGGGSGIKAIPLPQAQALKKAFCGSIPACACPFVLGSI